MFVDVKKVIDEVMVKVGKGDLEGGFKIFKLLIIIFEVEFDVMMGQVVQQLFMMVVWFGQVIGYEFIKEECIGELFVCYVYIQCFEKYVMCWMFYLYQGKMGWVINLFWFDDKWFDLF